MSYLDVPRLHFSGLFYTGPNTINNEIENYDPTTQLENPPGQYDSGAGWNPLGVAQWWLEECTVLSAVYNTGLPVPDTDAVINAPLQSPSPKTPMDDGTGGYYDIAKMVDLDPWQQGRSALYGVRIKCILPNGAGGFEGLMTIPELRQLNPRVYASGMGSWAYVGNWMGTISNVVWRGSLQNSPFLQSLKSSAQALNVKLTVDLHQQDPANLFTAGNQFCYGRVLGSIGPAFPSELPEVVPGRYLPTFSTTPSPAPALMTAPGGEPLPAREQVAARIDAYVKSREANAVAATASDPWNPAFALIRTVVGGKTMLSLDLGGSIPLNFTQDSPDDPATSDGTFEVNSGIVVGVFNLATKTFTPFAGGNINITPEYKQLDSTPKNVMLVKNSGVFIFEIVAADGNGYKTNPLAIQANGTTMVQEPSSGYWIDVSLSSQRLECGLVTSGQSVIMVRKFGIPVTGPVPVTTEIRLFNEQITNEVGVTFGNLNADGNATITTTVNINQIQSLPAPRQPLDSQIYYVYMHDSTGQAVGDSHLQAHTPPLTVLLFNAFTAPTNPTWANIAAIFGAYARLYPGMRSRLDISNQTTVVGDAESVLAHISYEITDPRYMPVTRDLSQAKLNMIQTWLKQQIT